MATSVNAAGKSDANWSTLGGLWTVYGIIRLAAAIVLVLDNGVATVMFGALLSRVGNPFLWMGVFHFFYAGAVVVAILAGVFSLLAGLSLLAGRASARSLSLVASFPSVSDIPLGTTLGIYTLILFLR